MLAQPFLSRQIPVCSGEEHHALLHAIPCWEHRPVLRLNFALGGVERIWQLVPVSQPCFPSYGITANIQSSRILCQFLLVWLGSSLLAFGTQQLDLSWQGGSPGGRFSAFSSYSTAVNGLMPTEQCSAPTLCGDEALKDVQRNAACLDSCRLEHGLYSNSHPAALRLVHGGDRSKCRTTKQTKVKIGGQMGFLFFCFKSTVYREGQSHDP